MNSTEQEVVATPSLSKGVFCLSLDTELSWGVFDYPDFTNYRKRFARSREVIDRLCELLDRYEIPATWAVVGRLMLSPEEGAKVPLNPYEEIEAELIEQYADEFYAPDIVERILACDTAQEIACHSFSHPSYGDYHGAKGSLAEDMNNAVEAARKYDINLKSFVFPYNDEGYHSILRMAGILAFRGKAQAWYNRLQGRLLRVGHWVDQFMGLPPRLMPCTLHFSGLWCLPASMFLMPLSGLRGLGGAASRVRKVRSGLRTAARKKTLFHLWTHPHNFYARPDKMLNMLERILKIVQRERDADRIETLSMEQTAMRLIENEAITA